METNTVNVRGYGSFFNALGNQTRSQTPEVGTIIHETHDDYKITQHPIHGLYMVSYFDKDLKKWLGIETCNTPTECHQVIKRCENTLGEILP